jgi:hypothetical protein
MKRFHSLALAAAVSASVVMFANAPAVADQGMQGIAAKPFMSRHHALHPHRWESVRTVPVTRVAAIPTAALCGGPWCGRDFVLLLGIGF